MHSSIILHHISYGLPTGKVLFQDLNLNCALAKIGLVGRNGVGKSTLLKLMANEVMPQAGVITRPQEMCYVPQLPVFAPGTSVASVWGIEKKSLALQRILQGSLCEQDYEILNDDWDLEQRLQQQLAVFGVEYLSACSLLSNLSGGELTRLFLARAFSSHAAFLLLDEPTNHLDVKARQSLYQAIEQWPGGLIVASHDRELLNKLDEIIELTSLGIARYGGNYQSYVVQKELEVKARQQLLKTREEIAITAKRLAQTRRERHEQSAAKGRLAKRAQVQAKGCYDKIEMNSAKGRSENTNRRIRQQAEHKLNEVENQWQSVKNSLEVVDEIKVDLPATFVPSHKMLLNIKNLGFSFPNQPEVLINNFSLCIQGPSRLALLGANGSGKTTLIKLILGELCPQAGTIVRGAERICYVDQNASLLHPHLSLVENYLHFNANATVFEAHQSLAHFLFKNEAAHKKVSSLSGGEKLRALLACVLFSKQPPQLLILDEPTNHLDLASVKSIESALSCFKGAMLVVSHDAHFLNAIGVVEHINSPFIGGS